MTDLAERLRWGGVDVDTWAVTARDLSGMLAMPGRRGENTAVAGRDGAVRAPHKPYSGREFVVEFILDGCNPDGTVAAAGQNRAFYDAVDTLTALATLDVAPLEHQLPNGTWRALPVEVLEGFEPSRELHGGHGRVAVPFVSHETWWRGLAPVSDTVTLAAGQTAPLPGFASSTGLIVDALVEFGVGASTGNNPRLVDTATGIGVGYNRTFAAADGLIVGDYTHTAVGFPFDRRNLVTDPRVGPWWVLRGGLPGVAPVVRLDLTGGGPMTVTVTARPSWAVG